MGATTAVTKGATGIEAPPAAPTAERVLDITKLTPGDIIEGRYKYIEKIGKGAFGTVLLMEDQVVDEDLGVALGVDPVDPVTPRGNVEVPLGIDGDAGSAAVQDFSERRDATSWFGARLAELQHVLVLL